MALTDSLISYWSLSEASGNALDAHGSYDLTETSGTIGSGTGKVGNARDFGGDTDSEYFVHADNADLSAGDVDFSFACWVKADTWTNSSGYPVIASKGWTASADTNREWVLFRNAVGNKLTFQVANSTDAGDAVQWGTSPLTATWYHIVCWHDATANEIGITVNDGTPVTTSRSAGVNDGNRGFCIGASILQGLYFDGLIDEFGFWKKVLSSSEITELYNSGSGLAYPFSSGSLPVLLEGKMFAGGLQHMSGGLA